MDSDDDYSHFSTSGDYVHRLVDSLSELRQLHRHHLLDSLQEHQQDILAPLDLSSRQGTKLDELYQRLAG
ncbi:hypothetical protein SAMN02745148_02358 [Modicisalibacter ilicicola DSM 19980]|uniref:Uncharacterized protein n=1 Tax=Modicisalibacter ilicicola DSM 19980 TaxID=1121942 RepID=A0A1M5AVT7_9GAMM|nr:hypothetical protein [Halomonas ilicicola]SHF34197.1 hypothetical protein SAMN02745148_02358 [Halomonas ilicicola DSM 19980]